MAQLTQIEWSEMVWNFLRGCRRVSEGCGSDRGGGCYAERQAIRHAGPSGPYEGLVKSTPKGPRWTGEISFHEDILLAPLRRKKPTTYFVNSMSDLFYEKVSDEILDKAFAVMALCPQHTFQILTKRPERMQAYMSDGRRPHRVGGNTGWIDDNGVQPWPLPNVWLGVSVEDQKTADERIPILLQTPAAVRWISAEPLLGPIDLRPKAPEAYALLGKYYDSTGAFNPNGTSPRADRVIGRFPKLDWVVTGGESGPGARPCDIAWIRSILDQCKAAGVPVFVKQLGSMVEAANADLTFPDHRNWVWSGHEGGGPILRNRKGGDPSEWPEDLRVREMPRSIAPERNSSVVGNTPLSNGVAEVEASVE
jgi:protein gp37